MRKDLFGFRSAAVLAVVCLSSPAWAQSATSVDSLTISGLDADAHNGLPDSDERDLTVNISGCQELVSDLSDTITLTYAMDNVDSGARYVIKLRQRGEACSAESLSVGSDECDRLSTEAELSSSFSVSFEVADLLGDEFDSASDCEDTSLAGTYSVLMVFEEDEDNDGTLETGEFSVDTLNFNIELSRPDAPSEVSVRAGETSLEVSWDEVSDADSYRVYVKTDVTDFENSTPEELSGGSTATGESRTVDDLTVDTTYFVAVVSVDENENRSDFSAITEVTTVPSDDFWELYRDAGGVEEGGCASAPSSTPPWALGLGIVALFALRRRRTRAVAGSLLAAAMLVTAPAHADISYDTETPINGAFELKLGVFSPNIDDEFGGNGPYNRLYGDKSPLMVELEYDYQFWRGVGSVGAFLSLGWSQVSASSLTDEGTRAVDKARFRVIPLRVGAVYRFDYLQERWNVPLVFSLKAGLDYYVWSTRNDSGISEHGSGGDATTGRGGTTGYHVGFGGYFLLDFLAPRMASQFDMNTGVNNSYLFAEYTITRIDDFGSSSSWDLSDQLLQFGIAFEF